MKFAKPSVLASCLLIVVCFDLRADPCTGFSLKENILNKGTWANSPTELNWGQGVLLTLSGPNKGVDRKWTIPKKTIRDYDERIIQDENEALSTKPHGFMSHSHEAAHLSADSISIYFQNSNVAGSLDLRKVELTFMPEGTNSKCVLSRVYKVSPAPRPVELYTSNHLSDGQLEEHKGRVIEDHFIWHNFHQFAYNIHKHPSFLHWHHLYIGRYKAWRKTFGYSDLVPISANVPFDQSQLYAGHKACTDLHFPSVDSSSFIPIDSKDFGPIEEKVILAHNDLHRAIAERCESASFGGFSGSSSPKSELFWRLHMALDEKYYKPYCIPTKKISGCPETDDY